MTNLKDKINENKTFKIILKILIIKIDFMLYILLNIFYKVELKSFNLM